MFTERQNKLTSSFLNHKKPVKAVTDHDYQLAIPEIPESSHLLQYPQLSNLTEIKTDTSTVPAMPEPKAKKGKTRIKIKLPIPPVPQVLEQNKEAKSIEDGMVKKIMDILVSRNQNQNAQEITKLVNKVRKIVAYGQIDQGSFEDEITQTVANVLLGKEPMPPTTVAMPQETATAPPVSDVKPVEDVKQKRGRGRPRKTVHETQEEVTVELKPELPVKSDKKKRKASEKVEDGRNRRKAAIEAKKQLKSIDDEIVDLDGDDDWPGANDNDYTPQEIIPKQKTEKPKPKSKKKEEQHKTAEPIKEKDSSKKQLNTEINSILLSDDDDDDAPIKKPTTRSEKLEVKKDAPIPLHPLLLSNKNFIKIIAHTYLEGNSSLDEDAATLAAKYSASRAQMEVETTGKPLDSGPIYDIAFKVRACLKCRLDFEKIKLNCRYL